ncbi:MAG: TonB-dependent receptor [Burkholderiales bacterium]|nr:TonB-dependent receptor [Burkholderiales bacterium]
MYKPTQVRRAVMAAMSGGWLIGSCTAYAQQAPAAQANAEMIVVTGSRIRTIDKETAQPVLTVTQEEIQKSGLVTVGDIVNALTESGTPAFSKGSTLTSNREQGGQYVDMRNLGAERVLVLVDGKRWSTSINGYTDVSNLPSALIERVEVLKDGASSIYGSDAIAGVVNFILKRHFEGGEATLYYGANEKGDGINKQFDFTFGARSDKASLIASATVATQGTVWANKRDISAYSYGPDYFDAGFGTGPWGRIRQVNPANGQAKGFNLYLDHTGSYYGDGVGQASNNPANYHPYAGDDADTFNATSQMMFTSPTNLKSLFVKGSYDLSSNVRLKLTGQYAERDSSRQIAGYPLNSRSQPLYPVFVDANSYYNPYGNAAAGAGNGQNLFFYRRTIEVPRVTDNNFKSLHLDGGVDGEFGVGGSVWNWDVGFNYNKGDGVVTGTGNLNLVNLKQALGPSFMNTQGKVQCGTAVAPIPLSQCVPFDLLGGPSASTPEALNYVMATTHGIYNTTMTSYTANLTGRIAKLPAGDLGLAVGAEYRKVSGYDIPDQLAGQGLTTDLAGHATSAGTDSKEVYAELNIPVLKGVPGAEALYFNLSTRRSQYETFGNTTNSKFSFVWKPIKDLMTRGTWAQGFRAPALGDLFGGGQQSFDSYLDPCDSRYGQAATDPNVAARCAAAGVPAGFVQVNQAGSPVSQGGAQGISPFNAGAGNAQLRPETAVTKTLGMVFNPSAVPGLSGSIDWYNIEVKQAVTGVSAVYVLNQCYVQNDPNFCTSIVRDPVTGMVTALSRGNMNLASILTEGYDLSLRYSFPKASWGKLALNLDTTYLSKFRNKSSETADWTDYAGEWPYYRVKANLALDWELGNWSARFMTRYFSGTKDQCWDAQAGLSCNAPNEEASWGSGVNHLAALTYNDLNVGWKTPWKGKISVGANNIFNVKPRINFQTNYAIGENGTSSSSSVDPAMPIDRFMYVRYSQAF